MGSARANFFALTIKFICAVVALALILVLPSPAQSPAQEMSQSTSRGKTPSGAPASAESRPKLVVILVIDQMRGDYIDKFQGQWTGGLKRLIEQGAWFHEAAYPYAATETCVGHSTVSTGAFPATHGMIANEWWDREQQKEITCTSDPTAKNIAYAGAAVSAAAGAPRALGPSELGGDSAVRMLVPAFADELKFQSGTGTRIVTMSLKARAAITLAGHQGDAVTWFDGITGSWLTSSAYPQASFIEEFVKSHPVTADYGKTWSPLLPDSAYHYDKIAVGAGPPAGYGGSFPHPLRGTDATKQPDASFYLQWSTSPYAETYLAQLAEAAVDKLQLGKGSSTDFLSVSFSSVDYVGHSFGPRSWEVQDELARLDRDLDVFFAHLDKNVGRGKYVVALTGDHGVAPVPEDLRKSGVDAGRLNLYQVKERIEEALESAHFPKNSVSQVDGADVYFSPGTYDKLKNEPRALQAVLAAIQSLPGVASVYQAEEMERPVARQNPLLAAEAAGFSRSRSGDLFIVPKPYWIWSYALPGAPAGGGTSHGTPYYYDQRVPVMLMGWGIRPGKYFASATPADIAPTLAALCGITLATRDGHVLKEALLASH